MKPQPTVPMSTRPRTSSVVSASSIVVSIQDYKDIKTSNVVNRKRRASSIVVTAVGEKELIDDIKIVNWTQLNEWQQDNEFIYDGYVQETNSVTKCMKSLKMMHNETINIWTHLIPSFFYLLLLIFFTDFMLEKKLTQILGSDHGAMDTIDYIMVNIFLLGAFLCLFCSSCFHCFKQHSENISNLWSKADYMGIIILISTSIISLLYYGFHDNLFLCKLFTILTTIFGATCGVFVLNDRFNHKDWKAVRASFFIMFAASGLLPIITGCFYFGIKEAINRVQLGFVFYEAVCYIAGALIYGFKVPECFYKPGKFDYFFNSHQIFHVCCVAGSIFHFKALIASFVHAKIGKHSIAA